jgi:hypothetical protein
MPGEFPPETPKRHRIAPETKPAAPNAWNSLKILFNSRFKEPELANRMRLRRNGDLEGLSRMRTSSAEARIVTGQQLASAVALVALTAVILLAMGRAPICTCGAVRLWHGVVASSENSQHISDWYTPSHVIHGFIFFGLTWIAARRAAFGTRLLLATVIEAAWEILENTDLIINRYRDATIALDYFGDSVLNSVSDIGAMVIGFLLASRLPVWLTVALAIMFELFTGWAVRDNLTLNVVMLLWPMEAIRAWQGGA